MNERNRYKRIEVIAKLLTQAASVAGTPEAEAFTDRAFQLTAALGIQQSGIPDAVVRHREFPVRGEFLHQRIILLVAIATALHCAHACWHLNPTAATVEMYGVQGHIDRVQLLYGPLSTRMFRQAMESAWSQSCGMALEDHRISWMHGFILSIRSRLSGAEATAAAEADRHSGTDVHTRRHITDAERAVVEKQRRLPDVRPSTYSPRLERDALAEGYRAGQKSDPWRPDDV